MKVDIKELPGSKREIRVEVPEEAFQEDLEAAYRKYQKSIALPGFRKGRAPMKLLKARLGRAIRKEVLSETIPDLYKEALDTQHLTPISEPELVVEEYVEGQPLAFTATFEVSPQMTVTGYKGMELVKTVYDVTDEDIDQHIQRLQEQHAEERSVDRPAQMGDFLLADLQELGPGSVPIIGRKAENVVIELGAENSPSPEFDRQLVGVSRGEKWNAEFTYREDYSNPRYAGQNRRLSVAVKEVKERILPTLDDEFARDLEYENIEELRTAIRQRMEAQVDYLSEQGVRGEMMNRLIMANPFDAPESMIEAYIDDVIDKSQEDGTMMSPEQEDEIRAKARDQAVREIKSYLILRSVAETEGIEVSEEDVERRIEMLAQRSNMGVNELKRSLKREDKLENIKHTLLEEKVWEFLMQHVHIKEAAPVPLWMSAKDAGMVKGED